MVYGVSLLRHYADWIKKVMREYNYNKTDDYQELSLKLIKRELENVHKKYSLFAMDLFLNQ